MDKALWGAFQQCQPQDTKQLIFVRSQLDSLRYFMVTLEDFIQTGKLKEDWLISQQEQEEEKMSYHHQD